MIGKITYIISTAGFRAMDGVISDERRRLDNAIAPAAYVSYDPRMMSVVGWHGYRIAFKGGTRNMILYALELLRKNYAVSKRYDNYEEGNYVVGVLLRDRARAYAFRTGTPEPEPDPTWLYFTMPNGGVVTLTKTGSPTDVTLEYSLDNGASWIEWIENGNVRTLTLAAGQTVHVRNTSATSTGFSISSSDYYQFSFDANTYAGGDIMSLLCIDPSQAIITNHCWRSLFENCVKLITAPDMSAVTSIRTRSCLSMYRGCTSLTDTPNMSAVTSIGPAGCFRMYQGCTSLTSAADISAVTSIGDIGCQDIYYNCTLLAIVRIGNPDISALNCLENWLYNVAPTGDFYCSAELTIPTGASGIPSGWTRHDI